MMQILFASEIEHHCGSQGLHANSVHLGGTGTNLPATLAQVQLQTWLPLPCTWR